MQLPSLVPPSGRTRAIASLAFACLGAMATLSAAPDYSRINKLFNGGTNGGGSGSTVYHSFRVPSIVKCGGAVLLAFCEGRVASESDWGNINLVYKRSTDNGATWSGLIEFEGQGPGAWTNPTTVYEAPWSANPSGRVHLFFNWHSGDETQNSDIEPSDRRTYYAYSDDNGLTWSTKQDLTSTLKPASWAWDAVGPGNGIVKTVAPNIGRLIVPATRRNFHSDDHGATWSYSLMPSDGIGNYTGESTIVECLGGELLRNDRATDGNGTWDSAKRRWISYGQIGAFPRPTPQENLKDPRMAASILRYNMTSPDRIIFLNSDSTDNRRRMKVRISYDDGMTWDRERWLYVDNEPDYHDTIDEAMEAGKGGYSSMTKIGSPEYKIAALVEMNESFDDSGSTSRSIDFHKFNLEWILNNQGEP